MTAPVSLYRPLDSTRREIRTIRLLPSSESSLVECLTEIVSLDEEPQYHAISYAWGDPTITTPIVLNGIPVEVTTNSEAALRRIRDDYHGDDPVKVWIDAVCIDQRNASEQSHQVQLMGKVYSQARMTYVWLGEQADDSDLAIDLIKAMGTGALDPADPKTWISIPELFQHRRWRAIDQLFHRPFWYRLWVLQEVVLAEDVLVTCGNEQLTWNALVAAFMILGGIRQWKLWEHFDTQTALSISYSSFMNLGPFLKHRLFRTNGALTPVITQVMTATRYLEVTDPRDKIYGLLGLADTSIVPDYTRSTADVYLDFARSQILLGEWQNISLFAGIGIVGSVRRTCDLPSWVCDWRAFSEHGSVSSNPLPASSYKAAGSSMEAIRIYPESTILWTQGVRCAKIVESERIIRVDLHGDSWGRFRPAMGEQTYPTGIPRLQALFRTLLADIIQGGKGIERSLAHYDLFLSMAVGFLSMLGRAAKRQEDKVSLMSANFDPVQAFLTWLGEDRHGRSDQEILAPLLGTQSCPPQIMWPEHKEWGRERPLFMDFYEQIRYNVHGRSFFWTEKSYIGIGPALLKESDIICVMLGCSIPFVLREVDDHYILVGHCFVLGFMDGEAMEAVEKGEASIQKFEIH